MPEITFEDSLRQIERVSRQARVAEEAGDLTAAIGHLRELLAHPCAHHQVAAYEVWDDIHHLYRRAGDHDAAIAAKQAAIEHGYRSEPDPEADIAECHLEAGRRADADRIYAELLARDPDDVWLYNSAGYAYAHAGDHREAERWLRRGIRVAITTGDPDRVVTQLLDMLDESLAALGEEPDTALTREVEAFIASWKPATRRRAWGDAPPVDERPCAHCGFDPAWVDTASHGRPAAIGGIDLDEVAAVGAPTGGKRVVHLSLAWFPAAEWAGAVERWPDLLDDLPRDHDAYSRRIEARVKWIARVVPGQPVAIAPMTVEGLVTHAALGDRDPGSGEARSAYAAELSRSGKVLRWPPGRNERCWCGSGRKYKACCGPVPPVPDD